MRLLQYSLFLPGFFSTLRSLSWALSKNRQKKQLHSSLPLSSLSLSHSLSLSPLSLILHISLSLPPLPNPLPPSPVFFLSHPLFPFPPPPFRSARLGLPLFTRPPRSALTPACPAATGNFSLGMYLPLQPFCCALFCVLWVFIMLEDPGSST